MVYMRGILLLGIFVLYYSTEIPIVYIMSGDIYGKVLSV